MLWRIAFLLVLTYLYALLSTSRELRIYYPVLYVTLPLMDPFWLLWHEVGSDKRKLDK